MTNHPDGDERNALLDVRCPSCGYSLADAKHHLDHHLCRTPDFFRRIEALLTEGAADMSTPARLAWKDRVREALK